MQRFMGSLVVVICLIGIAMAISALLDIRRADMEKCLERSSRDTCITALR